MKDEHLKYTISLPTHLAISLDWLYSTSYVNTKIIKYRLFRYVEDFLNIPDTLLLKDIQLPIKFLYIYAFAFHIEDEADRFYNRLLQ